MRLPVFRLAILPAVLLAPTLAINSAPGFAQGSNGVSITWEVKSRFRLFKNEDDFNYVAHFHAHNSVLDAEMALAADTRGKGWARRVLPHLCIDDSGQLLDICTRDYAGRETADRESIRELYLSPSSHRIGVRANGVAAGVLCTWSFATEGNEASAVTERDRPCSDEVLESVPYGKTTRVQLWVGANPREASLSATTNVKVRDILIAGLGDSTAAGEGNPDRPVALANDGFCFRRFLGQESGAYFRPNRAGYRGARSCGDDNPADAVNWAKQRAHWMNGGCHRSLYSYQVRVALTLAIENPHIAVTYIPLGCTGATINAGLLGRQNAREVDCDLGTGRTPCTPRVDGQVQTLAQFLAKARQRDRHRSLDLVLLTIGANDIDFSGLVANVMIDHGSREFRLFNGAGRIASLDKAKATLNNGLPDAFADLRTALKPLVGGKLERTVYVSYGHPALHEGGLVCPGGLQGFDVHPAFKIDGERLKSTSDFVSTEFFPRLKALATCGRGGGCQSPDQDRMTFVDEHQTMFKDHGFCAGAADDPPFDRECFAANGKSFRMDLKRAADQPLACAKPASAFRAYLPRARWIRTANDSYFAAMTYPDGVAKVLQPADIHDPIWGAASAVYGGAMHPTAQGYAAMADAALPAARRLLGLPASP